MRGRCEHIDGEQCKRLVLHDDEITRLKAEVERLRKLLSDSQSRRNCNTDCEGICDCYSFWQHVAKVLEEQGSHYQA